MDVSEGMLTSTAQVELALAGHEASGVTFMATPESPREVNQSVAIESLESSRAPVDGMPVDNDGVSIVEAVIALEIALVKCICASYPPTMEHMGQWYRRYVNLLRGLDKCTRAAVRSPH